MKKRGRSRAPIIALAAALALGLVAPLFHVATVAAHPLGNFTINRYARIELYRGEVVVHYVLDFAEIPAFQLKQDADTNGDDVLDANELDAFLPEFADEIGAGLSLGVAGEPIDLSAGDFIATVSRGEAALDIIRIALVFHGTTEATGLAEVAFSDANYEGRPGWREIVVSPSRGTLAVVDPAFLADRSNALREYPADSLDATPADASATFGWDPTTGEVATGAAAAEVADAVSRGGRFSGLLENDRSLGIILLSLLAAFGFGALHALGPGHGKSVVAAYLVGTKGTPRHALALGITVTATHTAAVYGLGFVTLVASDLIAPDRLFLYLGVVSGVMIVAMGLSLFASRVRSVVRRRPDGGTHRHGLFGRAHSHLPSADDYAHPHVHGDEGTGEHDHHAAAEPRVSWRGLLTLGVAGGIIPCPSALVVMLAAISLGQVVFGMLLIVAFSFGLAGVLVAIGLALVLGRRLTGKAGRVAMLERPAVRRAIAAVPLVSALGVTLAGLAITYQAWNQPGL